MFAYRLKFLNNVSKVEVAGNRPQSTFCIKYAHPKSRMSRGLLCWHDAREVGVLYLYLITKHMTICYSIFLKINTWHTITHAYTDGIGTSWYLHAWRRVTGSVGCDIVSSARWHVNRVHHACGLNSYSPTEALITDQKVEWVGSPTQKLAYMVCCHPLIIIIIIVISRAHLCLSQLLLCSSTVSSLFPYEVSWQSSFVALNIAFGADETRLQYDRSRCNDARSVRSKVRKGPKYLFLSCYLLMKYNFRDITSQLYKPCIACHTALSRQRSPKSST